VPRWVRSATGACPRIVHLVALDPARSERVRDTSFVLAPLGAALGASAGWQSFYGVTQWGPAAVVTAVLLIAALVLRPEPLPRPGLILILALGGFAAWSLASGWWAQSSAAAAVDGQRWVLYAMVTCLALLLARSERERTALLAGMAVGGLLATAALTVHLLGHGAASEFFARRLAYPVGYINGQGAAFGLLLWPSLAWAERGRHMAVRAAAAGAACLLVGLLLLTQSRGSALALAVTIVLVLVLVPGRLRRAWLLVVTGVSAGTVAGPLLDLYAAAPITTPVSPGGLHHALVPLLVASIVAAVAWGGLTSPALAPVWSGAAVKRAGTAVLCTGLVIVGASLFAFGHPVSRLDNAVHQFTSMDKRYAPGDSRLLSGSGNRRDYWRVALDAFKHRPLTGVGAGNYPRWWFALRRTDEDIRQPHSLWFQTLAETGVIGLLLLAAGLGAIALAVGRAAWRSREGRQALLAVAGVGSFGWWLVQTSVDWMHLLPGLTVSALVSAVLVLPRQCSETDIDAKVHPARRPLALTAIAVVVVCFATAGIGRTTVSAFFLHDARAALPGDPGKAIDRSRAALGLRPGNIDALTVEAAAYARSGDYGNARAALQEAIRLEPDTFVPYVLLGDLATRRGDVAQARIAYARAAVLNPLDPTIRRALTRARRS
jgi:O-antigen ligase